MVNCNLYHLLVTVQNGSGVIGEGRTPRRAGGGGRIGPEVVLDDVDSTQQ